MPPESPMPSEPADVIEPTPGIEPFFDLVEHEWEDELCGKCGVMENELNMGNPCPGYKVGERPFSRPRPEW